MNNTNTLTRGFALTALALFGVSAFARPVRTEVDSSKLTPRQASAVAAYKHGRISGAAQELANQGFWRDAPVFVDLYNGAGVNANTLTTNPFPTYKYAPGGVAPSGWPTNVPLTLFTGYQNAFSMDDMRLPAAAAGQPVRALWLAARWAPGSGDSNNLAIVISSENVVDITGVGPNSLSTNESVALFYDGLAAGGYALSSNLTTSSLQFNMPDTGGGMSLTFLTYDGSGASRTNFREVSSTAGIAVGYQLNWSTTGDLPVGTNPAGSDNDAWEDVVDATWDGVGANFVNDSDYQHDDFFTTDALGDNSWSELVPNDASLILSNPGVRAGTQLHHAMSFWADTNARVISGTVKLTGMVDPSVALIPEPAAVIQFDAKADDRAVPLVHVSGDTYKYYLVDKTQTGAGGVRNLSVKVPGFLRRNLTVNTTAGSVTNANLVLPNGEANDDTTVDFFDYLIVSAGYESAFPDAAYINNFTADFTRDGTIDFFDFLLLNDSYELEDDPELP